MARRNLQRKGVTKNERPLIGIFCEGKETEPNYFNPLCKEVGLTAVRGVPNKIYTEGTGRNTVSLVRYAEKFKDEYDEVWVVFDQDGRPQFDEAIALAKKEGINVAYSNECFELWFILHKEYYTAGNGRDNYFEKMSKILGKSYEKAQDGMYDLFKDDTATAISNAKKLLAEHAKANITTPSKMKPSTTVHLLVERLQEVGRENQ